jgi:hypothetical protein
VLLLTRVQPADRPHATAGGCMTGMQAASADECHSSEAAEQALIIMHGELLPGCAASPASWRHSSGADGAGNVQVPLL